MALIKKARGMSPTIDSSCFLADNATIVGDVIIGKQCSIWFNTVIRGDVHYIKIGNKVNIQDGAIIHCTYKKAPVEIGNNVSIGHNAIIHGCEIQDNSLIGMGAIIMDHVIVKENSFVAAGSVVLADTIVESGTVFAGVPAKKIKDITPELLKVIQNTPDNYIMYSEWFHYSINALQYNPIPHPTLLGGLF